jgi:hypothetical protein
VRGFELLSGVTVLRRFLHNSNKVSLSLLHLTKFLEGSSFLHKTKLSISYLHLTKFLEGSSFSRNTKIPPPSHKVLRSFFFLAQ